MNYSGASLGEALPVVGLGLIITVRATWLSLRTRKDQRIGWILAAVAGVAWGLASTGALNPVADSWTRFTASVAAALGVHFVTENMRIKSNWWALDAFVGVSSMAIIAWIFLYARYQSQTWADVTAASFIQAATFLGPTFLAGTAFWCLYNTSMTRKVAFMLASSGIILSLADTAQILQIVTPLSINSLWVNIASFAGLYLAGAALFRLKHFGGVQREEKVQFSTLLAPYVPGGLALGALIWMESAHDTDPVMLTLAGAAAAAALARQFYTVRMSKSLISKLGRIAYQDSITKLPNRAEIIRRAQGELGERDLAVALVDLDDFKLINDMMGHAVGDALLREVGARLQSSLPGCSVGRIGGDEFAVLGHPNKLETIGPTVNQALEKPMVLRDCSVKVRCSVGVTLAQAGADPQAALEEADIAMYAAKNAGKNQGAVYDNRMRSQVLGKIRVREDVSNALECNQLRVVYQPMLSLDTEKIDKAEALIRWHDPLRGEMSPDSFIPVIEETDLMVRVGNWVLHTACFEAARWEKEFGAASPMVSVNISPRQLARQEFVDGIESVLEQSGLSANKLLIEITENAVITDAIDAKDKLDKIKALGVKVALDDFGTGQSSLSRLRALPIDVIKVDRSFIAPLGGDEETEADRALAQVPVNVAKALGLPTVAEGVETLKQAQVLRELGYTQAQGWLYFKALEAQDILDTLRSSKPSLKLLDGGLQTEETQTRLTQQRMRLQA